MGHVQKGYGAFGGTLKKGLVIVGACSEMVHHVSTTCMYVCMCVCMYVLAAQPSAQGTADGYVLKMQ